MSSDHFSKEEIDRVTKWQFKGMGDALELMMKRPSRPSAVGRWDWHFWMFLVTTCLPCFGVYCMAMWVRSSVWEERKKNEEKRVQILEKRATNDPISELKEEIARMKVLMLLNRTHHPVLSLEGLKKLLSTEEKKSGDPSLALKQSEPQKDTKKPFSERLWSSIKSWLPFYVEPLYKPTNAPPPKTDFRAIMKFEEPPE